MNHPRWDITYGWGLFFSIAELGGLVQLLAGMLVFTMLAGLGLLSVVWPLLWDVLHALLQATL